MKNVFKSMYINKSNKLCLMFKDVSFYNDLKQNGLFCFCINRFACITGTICEIKKSCIVLKDYEIKNFEN